MGPTKETLAADNAVSDQQALVKTLLGPQPVKPLKHIIPGGRSLFKEGNEMNVKELEIAIYTWLRRVRSFDECTISFSAQPTRYNLKTVRVIDFPTETTNPIWAIPAKGKGYLARVMAETIAKNALVTITAKKDGLYISTEASSEFGPSSKDWEPYVEFVRSKRSEYSVY